MTLSTAHRILITCGIVLGLILMAFAAGRWFLSHDASMAPTGVIGAIATVTLFAYLRWFNRKTMHTRG